MARDALVGVYLIKSVSTQPQVVLTHVFRGAFLIAAGGAVFEHGEQRLREQKVSACLTAIVAPRAHP